MRKFLGALLLCIAPLAVSAPLKPSELAAAEVVSQFVDGCFMSFPYPEKFTVWLTQSGFQKLSSSGASGYLGGYPGSAWNVQLLNSSFVLTTLGTGACSIFANDLDEAMTKNLMVGFLDYLKTQGATYQSKDVTPDSATGGGSSTSYSVSTGGEVIMNLTLSIAPIGSGKSKVALTASKAGT